METLLMVALAVAVQPLFFVFTFAVIGYMVYFLQEVNCIIRGLKRSVKQAMWDLEWKLKLMKGR